MAAAGMPATWCRSTQPQSASRLSQASMSCVGPDPILTRWVSFRSASTVRRGLIIPGQRLPLARPTRMCRRVGSGCPPKRHLALRSCLAPGAVATPGLRQGRGVVSGEMPAIRQTTKPSQYMRMPSRHPQGTKGEYRVDFLDVLLQAAEARHHRPDLLLDHAERLLDSGADAGLRCHVVCGTPPLYQRGLAR